MNHNPNEVCGNCRSFVRKADTDAGYCCHTPPIRLEAGVSSFPTMGEGNWCRKWEAAQVHATPAATPVPNEPPVTRFETPPQKLNTQPMPANHFPAPTGPTLEPTPAIKNFAVAKPI